MSKKESKNGNRKRIALTVKSDLDDILESIAESRGMPKSKVIVELLENAKPILSAVSDMLKASVNSEKAYYHALKLSHVVNTETGNINKQMLSALNQMDMDFLGSEHD